MQSDKDLYIQVDDNGQLVMPPEIAAKYGLKPGSRVRIDEERDCLNIHRSPHSLAKLYIEPTNLCNLDCRTCIRNTWDEPMGKMSEAVFDKIMEDLRGFPAMPSIFFGGFGEPLFHPRIVDMVVQAHKLGAYTELITNATLLTEEMSYNLIKGGLDMLWVSLDGATPESYADVRLGATLPKVLENLTRFRETAYKLNRHASSNIIPDFRIEIGIAFVAMKRNINDLPAIISLAQRFGATRISVSNVLPYTRDMCDETLFYTTINNYSAQHLSMPRMDINDATRNAVASALSKGLNINWDGKIREKPNGRCSFIENGTGVISWDGNLSPCLALMHSSTSYSSYLTYGKRYSQRWAVGNIMKRNLSDLWNDPEHIAFRERVQAFTFSPCTICGGCELSETNEEDCLGNKFPTCGGCLWGQGIIQCP
jgi:MoaA/NifB/PqqE/SkfB family radical SAM enzyme